MEDIESGASMIALRSGVRLLPAFIASKPRMFHTTHVYFHEPVSVKDIAAKGINKEACDAVSKRITGIYREMIEVHEKNMKK